MDFTYATAFALSLLVGFFAALLLALAGKAVTRTHYRRMFMGVVAADFLLLVNWSRLSLDTSWILIADLVFFTLYGAIGIGIGMAPAIAVRAMIRRLRR